jgi:ribosomal protein L37AE/L43A
MYSYKEQREIIDTIHVKDGQGFNMNCPFCGGRKTFGIAKRDGKKMWHCFKVSCGIKGVYDDGMSTKTMRKKLAGVQTTKRTKALLPIPSMLGDPQNYPAAMDYLKKNNCLHAYENRLIQIRYEPVERRVLFFNEDMSGAVGRSITGQIPKWKQYGDIPGIIKVGDGEAAIVVEDVPSACAVASSTEYSGCAILGTVLSVTQKRQLMHFTNVTIALDKDARKKSLALMSKLQGRVPTNVVFLEDDLKWLTGDQIQAVLS